MKIKNIRDYRKFYKEKIRGQLTRDENFIGNFRIDEDGEVHNGWFDLYHGDKEGFGSAEAGIENFLQSFLDMARDGQAVYEFLQNAVDAGSTHYTMVWGKDPVDGNHYLMVANNGDMFSLNSVRSILNVGSSTKSADSQTIGKFGIGFKLAHRLVGKNNGLEELINENSGPLLFSWDNYDLNQLARGEAPEPEPIDIVSSGPNQYKVIDSHPWLFKILITCFPCLPENNSIEELPRMTNGIRSEAAPFSRAEYEVLSRWVNKYQHVLSQEDYKQGSIFFLKLGEGKENELAEQNLQEGVKFALAILNKTSNDHVRDTNVLRTVQLNDGDPITLPVLDYLKISIDRMREKDTYSYIRFGTNSYDDLSTEQQNRIAKEADIEVLFGFKPHGDIGSFFKGAPNFYLYFPLSEEVHNFNYILHSNAFYKGSSRTFLHKGGKEDGINERLLRTIVDKVEELFVQMTTSVDPIERKRFLDLYAALLSSGKSTTKEREWIDKPYIDRITLLLKKYVPVRVSLDSDDFIVVDNPARVFIRDTKIDIDLIGWGMENVSWFYWGEGADQSIRLQSQIKLDIKKYTVFSLLDEKAPVIIQLNQWIGSDPSRMSLFLEEIAREGVLSAEQRTNLFSVNLLLFNDQEVHSVNSFIASESDGYFVARNKLSEITDILGKLKLNYTLNNVDQFGLIKTYSSYFGSNTQLNNYEILTNRFSEVVKDEHLKSLSADEKLRIFNAFRNLNDTPKDRLKNLKVFANKKGQFLRMEQLMVSTDVPWLKGYVIEAEYSSPVPAHLIKEKKDIYEGVIVPFWEKIAEEIALKPMVAESVLTELSSLYEASEWLEKSKNRIEENKGVFFRGEFSKEDKLFYDEALLHLPEKDYKRLQETLYLRQGIVIPDLFFLKSIEQPVFNFSSNEFSLAFDGEEIASEDIGDLLTFSKIIDYDFFDDHCIRSADAIFSIVSGETRQIHTSNAKLLVFIHEYRSDEFTELPPVFQPYVSMLSLVGNGLVDELLSSFSAGDLTQELKLIEALLGERHEDRLQLFKKLDSLNFDGEWKEERQNILYLKFAHSLLEESTEDEILAELHDKINVSDRGRDINIGTIHNAEDIIQVSFREKLIDLSQARLLGLEDEDGIPVVEAFCVSAIERGYVPNVIAEKLFKRNKSGITAEFIEKFKDGLEEMKLVNTHQLIFVLFSGKFSAEEIRSYSVGAQNCEYYQLRENIYFHNEENIRFLSGSYVLSKEYVDLQERLGTGDLEPTLYGEEANDILLPRFLFVQGATIGAIAKASEMLLLFEYLYGAWRLMNQSLKSSLYGSEWGEILGLRPELHLLSEPRTGDEELPFNLVQWLGEDGKKRQFLEAMGFHGLQSEIVLLREWLSGQSEVSPAHLDPVHYHPQLLTNTMLGLSGLFFENTALVPVFTEGSEKIFFLEKSFPLIAASKGFSYVADLCHLSFDNFTLRDTFEEHALRMDAELLISLQLDPDNNLIELFEKQAIVKNSVCDFFDFGDLTIKSDFIKPDPESGHEHDEPFYKTWKVQYGMRLFKVDELNFDIEWNDMKIGQIDKGSFYVNSEGKGYKDIYYRSTLSLEQLQPIAVGDVSVALLALISSKDNMLKSLYNVMNAAGKDEFRAAHLDALKRAMEQEDISQQRNEFAGTMQNVQKYSYDWFCAYLHYMETFEFTQQSMQQKTISFQEIKPYVIENVIIERYFLLKGANGLVPVNIEDFSDFHIDLILSRGQLRRITVEGVSRKGQDLLAYCRKVIDSDVLENLKEVVSVRISFVPKLDLFRQLFNAFNNHINILPWDNIQEALPNVWYIYGPPGTGKTTEVCKEINKEIASDSACRILLLTPTNKAADVVAGRLIKEDENSSILRIGKATDPELEPFEIYRDSLSIVDVECTNVIASTVHRMPYFKIDTQEGISPRLFEMEDHWDLVIFDEASMISLPYMVFCIMAIKKNNPSCRFIIAGDPQQIPPISELSDADREMLDVDEENIYKMMQIQHFDSQPRQEREGDRMTMLDTQYRSLPEIGSIFSDLAYGGKLKHDREVNRTKPRKLPEKFHALLDGQVSFLNMPLNNDNPIYQIGKLFYSSYHMHSALMIAEMVMYLDQHLELDEIWKIGLISPYKAQAVLMNKIITAYGISDRINVICDTVHGFQGDECDIVFFVVNPNNTRYTGWKSALLSKKYIYNVAISRAKDYLVILHPNDAIGDNTYINKVERSYAIRYHKPLWKNTDVVEKLMFGRKGYIAENSYMGGHDNINIFMPSSMRYFVKSGDQAIDIQLGKDVGNVVGRTREILGDEFVETEETI
jgi:hypothetical protein